MRRWRGLGSGLVVVVPFLVTLVVWLLASPRVEVVSVGDGRGVGLPDSGAAGAAQLLLLAALTVGSATASTVLAWRGRPAMWRPLGVAAVGVVVALLSALTAAAAPVVSRLFLAPERGAGPGQVVSLPPDVGGLYFGPILPGTTGPTWADVPTGAGWAVLGALCATATLAVMTYVDASRGLAADRSRVSEGSGDPGPVDATPRTGR